MTSASASKPLPTPPPATFVNREAVSSSPRRDVIDNNIPMKASEKTTNQDTNDDDDDEEFEFFNNFEREKVKIVIHSITAELKDRGADVEYLMIPFRPQQTNEKLLKLLNSLFPMGNGQPVPEKQMWKIVKKAEPLTLFQGLKYIWCRLPEGQVVSWKAYLEFKRREKSKDYPRRAFLEIMPQCLESPSHASIVYDYFDLIITLASNSRINKMSARKISKMCAIWAFGVAIEQGGKSLDYDFTNTSTLPSNSFQDGLDEWIPGTDAMFHLLLAFLKSFVPQELESAKLPLSLKSLLFNNDYPPKGSTAYSSETVLTIPLVTLQTDKFSRKPWQLLERCNELLDFTDHDAFQAREDFALLKSLFKKKNNVEGISRKMSQESRRLMKLMSTKHSTFQAGWATRKCLPNESNLKENIEVSRVEIDDYFIWAWLSTLSYEQTSQKKKLFGRSLILEFEFDGFKKWVMFQECDITLESRKRQRQRDMEPPVASPKVAQPVQQQVDSQRKVTPTYDNFQNRVPSSGSRSADSSSGEMYHTVISKESLGKNNAKNNVNLHSIEQKFSKWNPLSKVKKKGSNHSTSSSKEEMLMPDIKQKKKESMIINPHHSIYQLPPIECDNDDFKDIFAAQGISEDEDDDAQSLDITSAKPKRTPPPQDYRAPIRQEEPNRNSSEEAMEELKGMVDQMMTDDISKLIIDDGSSTTVNSTREIFEDFTKFDQYKPSNEEFADTPTSSSSAVPSLRLDHGVPSLKPADTKPLPQVVPITQGPPPLQIHKGVEQRVPRDMNKRLPEIRIDEPSEANRSVSPQRVPAPTELYAPRHESPPMVVRQEHHVPTSAEYSSPRPFVQPTAEAQEHERRRRQSPTRPDAALADRYTQRQQSPPRAIPQDQYGQRQQSPPRPREVVADHYTHTRPVAQQENYVPVPQGQRQHSPPRPMVQPQPEAAADHYTQPRPVIQDPYTHVPQAHRQQSPPKPLVHPPQVQRHHSPPEAVADHYTQPRPVVHQDHHVPVPNVQKQHSPREPVADRYSQRRDPQRPTGQYPPATQAHNPRQDIPPVAADHYQRQDTQRPIEQYPPQTGYYPQLSPIAPDAGHFAQRQEPIPADYARPPEHYPSDPYTQRYAPAMTSPQAQYPHGPAPRGYASPELRYYKNERPARQAYGYPRAPPQQQFTAPIRSPSPGRPMRSPPMPKHTNVPFAPAAPHATKLHGQTNRQQERKKLHNNIRNGNFGI